MTTRAWILIFVYLVAFVPLVDPGRPMQDKVVVLMLLGFFTLIYRGTSSRTGTAAGKSYERMTPELRELHERLLQLVFFDEGLALRLVRLEGWRGSRTREERYRAAIARLLRDRA